MDFVGTNLRTDKTVTAWHIAALWFFVTILPILLIVFLLFPSTYVKSHPESFDRSNVIDCVSNDVSSEYALILKNRDVFESHVEPIIDDKQWYDENESNLEYKCTLTLMSKLRFWENIYDILYS